MKPFSAVLFGVLYFVSSRFVSILGDVCQSPKVVAQSYTTQDATIVTKIAYIAEFSLDCSNGLKDLLLYADVSGQSLPVFRNTDGSKYQVSWTEDVKIARKGDFSINLYGEDGFAALRKAQRVGEPISSVKPLVTIVLNHPGAYHGPWVNTEFMAAVLAGVVGYVAFSAKSKLLS